MTPNRHVFSPADQRLRDVMHALVELYLTEGQPIGSKFLSENARIGCSPSTLRNVFAQLEGMGLIESPHISAGRKPTPKGLRLFVDGLMKINQELSQEEQLTLQQSVQQSTELGAALTQSARTIADLTRSAVFVYRKGEDLKPKYIEMRRIAPEQLLVVLVDEAGNVSNRLIPCIATLTDSELIEARNFLENLLREAQTRAQSDGKSLNTMISQLRGALKTDQDALSIAANDLVARGVAVVVEGQQISRDMLVVLGHNNLLADTKNISQIEHVRALFDLIDQQERMIALLSQVAEAEDMNIFIGEENDMFSVAGWSMVTTPLRQIAPDACQGLVGAIGVIGPSHMNYGRIVNIVEYTRGLLSEL